MRTQDGAEENQRTNEPVEFGQPSEAAQIQEGFLDSHEHKDLVEGGEPQSAKANKAGDLEVQGEIGPVGDSESESVQDAQDEGLEDQAEFGPIYGDELQSVKGTQAGDLKIQKRTGVVEDDESKAVKDAQDDEREREEQDDDSLFEDCSFEGSSPLIDGGSGDVTPVQVDLGTPQHDVQFTENADSTFQNPVVETSSGADRPHDTNPEDYEPLSKGSDKKPAGISDVSEAPLLGDKEIQQSGGSDTSLEDDTAFGDISFDGCDLFGEPLDPNAMDGIDFSDSVHSTNPTQQTPSGDQALDGASAPDAAASTNTALPTHEESQVMDGTNVPEPTSSTNSIQQAYGKDQVMKGTNDSDPTSSTIPTQQIQDEDQLMGGTDLPDDNSPAVTNQESQNDDQIMEDVGGASTTIIPSHRFGSGSQDTQGISPASFVPVVPGSFTNPHESGLFFSQGGVQPTPVVSTNYAGPSANHGSEDLSMSDENDPPVATQPSGDTEDYEMDEAAELGSAIESFQPSFAGRQNVGFTNNQSTAALQSTTPVVNVPNRGSAFQEAFRNVTSQAANSVFTPSSTYVHGNHAAASQLGGATAYQNTASFTNTGQTTLANIFNGISPASPAPASFQNPIPQMPTSRLGSLPPQQNLVTNRGQLASSLSTAQVQDPGVASRRRANRNTANGRVQSRPAVPSDDFNRPFAWAEPIPDTPEDIAEREAWAAELQAKLDADHEAEDQEKEKRLFAQMDVARSLYESPSAATPQRSAEKHTPKTPQAQRTTASGPVRPQTRASHNNSRNALRKMAARNVASSNERRATLYGSSRAHTSAFEPNSAAETTATAPELITPTAGPSGNTRRNAANAEQSSRPSGSTRRNVADTEQPSASGTGHSLRNSEIPPRDDPPIDDQAQGYKRKNPAQAADRSESNADQAPKKCKSTMQHEEYDPKLKGSVKYNEVGCAIPPFYNFQTFEIDKTITEA